MNSYLIPFLGEEEFATALLMDLTERDTITLTSCGHPPAVLVRANGVSELLEVPAGMPLGVGESTDATSFAWEPGDRVLLYTDGLSEARDVSGEFSRSWTRLHRWPTAPWKKRSTRSLPAFVHTFPAVTSATTSQCSCWRTSQPASQRSGSRRNWWRSDPDFAAQIGSGSRRQTIALADQCVR